MKLNVLSVAKRLRRSGAIITVAVAGMLLLTQCFVKRPSMTSGVVDKVALMCTIVNFQQPLGINDADCDIKDRNLRKCQLR